MVECRHEVLDRSGPSSFHFLHRAAASRKAKAREAARRSKVGAKYADFGTRSKTLDRLIWQGMTEEQLIDSWGTSNGRTRRVLKTKVEQTLRYGIGRSSSSVYIENGLVTGWWQPQP
jgi:hypothetical protein